MPPKRESPAYRNRGSESLSWSDTIRRHNLGAFVFVIHLRDNHGRHNKDKPHQAAAEIGFSGIVKDERGPDCKSERAGSSKRQQLLADVSIDSGQEQEKDED